jgi:hypothetical protein
MKETSYWTKSLLTILFLSVAVIDFASGQVPNPEEFPFQVVIARNTFGDGNPLKTADYAYKETEFVLTDGWVLLLHRMGFFLELRGTLHINGRDILKELSIPRISHLGGHNINSLLFTQWPTGFREKNLKPVNSKVYPVSSVVCMETHKLYLEWAKDFSLRSYITVMDVHNEVTEVGDTNLNNFTLDVSKYESFGYPLFLTVKQLEDNRRIAGSFEMFLFGNLPDYVIKTSEPNVKTSSQALVYGYFLERSRPDIAHGYFILATELSDAIEFREFLHLFRMRNGF